MARSALPVGARERRQSARALAACLALGAAFVAVTWWTKGTPAWDLRQPWQDDPYDVLVSLDFAVVPLLIAAIGWRTLLCRRYSILSARRLVDLLRASLVVVAVCAATESAEWVAVALDLHRAEWNVATGVQIGALAAFSAVTIAIGLALARAARAVRAVADPVAQPDWLADAVSLAFIATRRLRIGGKHARIAVRRLDRTLIRPVRRHPVAAAAALACLLAVPFVIAKAVFETYPPLLLLLSFVLPAMALFVFVIVAGSLLRIVSPGSHRRSDGVVIVAAACAAGPALFAFHDSLPAFQSAGGLLGLLAIGALAGAGVAFLALALRRSTRARRA